MVLLPQIGNFSANGVTIGEITSSTPNQSDIGAINPSQLLITNASTPVSLGGAPPIVINSSASQCADLSTTTAYIAEFLNGDSPPQSTVTIGCSTNAADTFTPALNVHGLAVFGGQLKSDTFKNTGLVSSTVSPLCGASGTNESQCTLTPLFATTGNASAATGAIANTYQQLGGTQTFTTGTSNGPNGEWLVKIAMPLNVGSAGLSGEDVYGCIVSSSTFTVEDATKDGSATCATSLTNSFAGTVPFGQASSSGSSPLGLSVAAEADLIVANTTMLTVKFEVAGSTATSATVYGYGTIQATPY